MSIKQITEQCICTGCGACAGICPQSIISMVENKAGFLVAVIDEQKCVSCGQCMKVCPSYYKNQCISDDVHFLHGNKLEGRIGHATNIYIRREGQSGGIVTALLLYLLNSGNIDGAIINTFNTDINRPKAIFADTQDLIMSGSGSYYSQTSVVHEILKNQGKRLAAVVLGCEAEALELYAKQTKHKPVEYTIGLVCAGQNSGRMIDRLIEKAGCQDDELIRRFRFRYTHPAYGGWPGNVFVLSDRRRMTVDKKERHYLKHFYESYRCLLCYDQMCIHADIVCGDPWGIPGNNNLGETVVIAHTHKGVELINNAEKAGYISVTAINPEVIICGQTVDTRHKEKFISGYKATIAKNWMWPYSTSDAPLNMEKIKKRNYKGYLKRLEYTRAFYSAKSELEIKRLTETLQKHMKKKETYEKIINKIAMPIRFISFLKRLMNRRYDVRDK